jgi:predicted acylesterase/phospholipase RssA
MRNIRFYLSGGGTKCSYQANFLKTVMNSNKFNRKYRIESIYGVSFGALVGFYSVLGKHDEIIKQLSNVNSESLIPCVSFFGLEKYIKKIPIIGSMFTYIYKIIWLIYGIFKKGLYSQINIKQALDKLETKNCSNLVKFKCLVYNVDKNSCEVIRGDHPLIKEYILAAIACWGIFPPKKIIRLKTECICTSKCMCTGKIFCNCVNDKHKFNEYIDYGIIQHIPFENCLSKRDRIKDDTIKCVLTTDDLTDLMNGNNKLETGSNLLEYYHKLLAHSLASNLSYKMKTWNNKNMHIINYKPLFEDATTTNSSDIIKMIDSGKLIAEKYIEIIDNDIDDKKIVVNL